jgi:iron complex outermembrane receptor protein
VRVHTLKPSKEFHGDLNLNFGSWGYQKGSFSVGGGAGDFRFLLSGSAEQSEQYEDGDGNNFVGQINRNIQEGKVAPAAQFQPQYQDMNAFEKKTAMAKVFWDISDNQELRLGYTANRSDNILYPSSKMDALYDDSDIFTAEYIAKDLGSYSKELNINLYSSTVEHPMSTKYRKAAATNGFDMTHKLNTEVQGAKIKNSFEMGDHTITAGVDYSKRNWDGGYYKNSIPLPEAKFHSIYDVDTENIAFFMSDSFKIEKFVLDMGLRYDDTTITTASLKDPSNDYNILNGYITATYHSDEQSSYFVGIGKSSRVPDAKELYWKESAGNPVGTPDLDATINYELDVGLEKKYENSTIKAKVFYSMLDNYIAFNDSNNKLVDTTYVTWNAYENVDATLYGI